VNNTFGKIILKSSNVDDNNNNNNSHELDLNDNYSINGGQSESNYSQSTPRFINNNNNSFVNNFKNYYASPINNYRYVPPQLQESNNVSGGSISGYRSSIGRQRAASLVCSNKYVPQSTPSPSSSSGYHSILSSFNKNKNDDYDDYDQNFARIDPLNNNNNKIEIKEKKDVVETTADKLEKLKIKDLSNDEQKQLKTAKKQQQNSSKSSNRVAKKSFKQKLLNQSAKLVNF
jgi:hypothetical protein